MQTITLENTNMLDCILKDSLKENKITISENFLKEINIHIEITKEKILSIPCFLFRIYSIYSYRYDKLDLIATESFDIFNPNKRYELRDLNSTIKIGDAIISLTNILEIINHENYTLTIIK